jgi:molybdenum cofactor synthesis domain-containing protein
MYVACGAPIPKGADAVLRVEYANVGNGTIVVKVPLEPGRNICRTGEDLRKDELAVRKGRVIRPQDIGLLVALNRERVKVVSKPRVAILSVGDELTEPFRKTQNKTINNNAFIVSSLVQYFSGEPVLLGIARDNIEDISRKIASTIENVDVFITIAGCSVGIRDYVPDAIRSLGEPAILFHGVALSAGKVSGFAVIHGRPIVMLPGHVGSTVAAFYLLVTPLLNKLQGLGFKDTLPTVTCALDEAIKTKPSVDLVLPVKVYREERYYRAIPLKKPLSVLKNLSDANGYAIIPGGKVLAKDATVDVKLYGGLEFNSLSG